MRRFVPYYRVSSINHGRRGFGLKDQRAFLRAYLASSATEFSLASEHVELKSARSLARRPVLTAALQKCQRSGATLLIARLQRLRRDSTFLYALLESGVTFLACDMPKADRLLVEKMAVQAKAKGEKIGRRTKRAMAGAKAHGAQFGNRPGETLLTQKHRRRGRLKGLQTIRHRAKEFAWELSGTLESLAAKGIVSASGVARALNAQGIPTRKGGQWSAMQVQRLRKVLGR